MLLERGAQTTDLNGIESFRPQTTGLPEAKVLLHPAVSFVAALTVAALTPKCNDPLQSRARS